jgi:hypothetical protein
MIMENKKGAHGAISQHELKFVPPETHVLNCLTCCQIAPHVVAFCQIAPPTSCSNGIGKEKNGHIALMSPKNKKTALNMRILFRCGFTW